MLGGRAQRLDGVSTLLLSSLMAVCLCISGLGGEPVNWQLPDTRVRYQTEADNSTPFCDILVSAQAAREDVCAVQKH